MRFLVDNQLPAALADFVRSRGHGCDHVLALGMDEADDVSVWSRAARDGSILISKDDIAATSHMRE